MEPLDVAKVSPFIVESHEVAGFLLIPLVLHDSVGCDELTHKISTGKWGEPLSRRLFQRKTSDGLMS